MQGASEAGPRAESVASAEASGALRPTLRFAALTTGLAAITHLGTSGRRARPATYAGLRTECYAT